LLCSRPSVIPFLRFSLGCVIPRWWNNGDSQWTV
jgi:hypothetical protein